jgi:hypothetical protein
VFIVNYGVVLKRLCLGLIVAHALLMVALALSSVWAFSLARVSGFAAMWTALVSLPVGASIAVYGIIGRRNELVRWACGLLLFNVLPWLCVYLAGRLLDLP